MVAIKKVTVRSVVVRMVEKLVADQESQAVVVLLKLVEVRVGWGQNQVMGVDLPL